MLTGSAPSRSMLPSAMKSFASPALAESERLELVEDDRAEVLVEHRHVDVVGPEPDRSQSWRPRNSRFGEHREVGVVVVVHHAPVAEMGVGGGFDAHRRLRKVARAVGTW